MAAGCQSLLELKYLRDVERAHGLPRGERQARRAEESRYDDVRYREYRTRVELDGKAAHPDHLRWRDHRRDNAAALDGDLPLRFGHGDVNDYPCAVATDVALVLRRRRWTDKPHRCRRPDCDLRGG